MSFTDLPSWIPRFFKNNDSISYPDWLRDSKMSLNEYKEKWYWLLTSDEMRSVWEDVVKKDFFLPSSQTIIENSNLLLFKSLIDSSLKTRTQFESKTNSERGDWERNVTKLTKDLIKNLQGTYINEKYRTKNIYQHALDTIEVNKTTRIAPKTLSSFCKKQQYSDILEELLADIKQEEKLAIVAKRPNDEKGIRVHFVRKLSATLDELTGKKHRGIVSKVTSVIFQLETPLSTRQIVTLTTDDDS